MIKALLAIALGIPCIIIGGIIMWAALMTLFGN